MSMPNGRRHGAPLQRNPASFHDDGDGDGDDSDDADGDDDGNDDEW